MKLTKTLAALCSLFFLFPSIVLAQNNDPSKRTVILNEKEVVNKDYFAAGDTVELRGTVNGDAYVAGNRVIITGTVNGDVLAAGGNVTIDGKVTQNVRAAGGELVISGLVNRNVTVAGGNLTIADTATVGGSMVAAGGTVTLNGPVGKDSKIAAGTLNLNNALKGSLDTVTDNLHLGEKATVAGSLNYWSNQALTQDPHASVSGGITHQQLPERQFPSSAEIKQSFSRLGNFLSALNYVTILVIGLALISLFPGLGAAAFKSLTTRPWASLGIGLLIVLLVPVVFVILLISLFGIPAAFVLAAIYLVFLYCSRALLFYAVGKLLTDTLAKNAPAFVSLLVGAIVLFAVAQIPVFGSLVGMVAILFGFGMLFLALKNRQATA